MKLVCGINVFVVILMASDCGGMKYDGLRVKFAYKGDQTGKENFFSIPRTAVEAQSQRWHRADRPAGPMPTLHMYCYPRQIICALYSTTGFVAGLQIAIPVSSIDPALLPERYFTRWTPSPAAEGEARVDYWTSTQFYVSEDFLKAGGPTAANGSTLQDGGVWVNDVNGHLMKIPLNEDLMKPPFGKTVCIPKMGLHYYYNVSRQFDCSYVIMPWFTTFSDGQLQGVGFQTVGKYPFVPEGERKWFEPIPLTRASVLLTRPDASECMIDLHKKYGTISIHVYFVEKPWTIKCSSAKTSTMIQ